MADREYENHSISDLLEELDHLNQLLAEDLQDQTADATTPLLQDRIPLLEDIVSPGGSDDSDSAVTTTEEDQDQFDLQEPDTELPLEFGQHVGSGLYLESFLSEDELDELDSIQQFDDKRSDDITELLEDSFADYEFLPHPDDDDPDTAHKNFTRRQQLTDLLVEECMDDILSAVKGVIHDRLELLVAQLEDAGSGV